MRRYPRRVQLFHRNKMEGQIFTFNTETEESKKKAEGWVEWRGALLQQKEEAKTKPADTVETTIPAGLGFTPNHRRFGRGR